MKETGLGKWKGWFILCTLSVALSFVVTPVHAQWTRVSTPYVSSNWELTSVNFVSTNEGWAVGYDPVGGVILHYLNGTWTQATPELPVGLFSVHFVSNNEGWAVGYDLQNDRGALLHYFNGNWIGIIPPETSSTGWYLMGVHFTSASEGWAVGEGDIGGVMLHYSNGRWVEVQPPSVSSNWGLYGVHFTSPGEGWAIGRDYGGVGVLLHYLKGSWTRISLPSVPSVGQNFMPLGLHFTSSNEGWVVGGGNKRGILLHYLNGTWTAVPPPSVSSDWTLASVQFTSPDNGWAVGYDSQNKCGALLQYLNGVWTGIVPPYVSNGWGFSDVNMGVGGSSSISFVSPYEGWASGIDWGNGWDKLSGVLLKYYTAPPDGPDLTGAWVTRKQTCSGAPTRIKCKITGSLSLQNIGNEAAPSTYIDFYLSETGSYDPGGTPLKTVSTGMLKAKKNKTVKLNHSLPVGQSASGQYVIAVIDKGGLIQDINKGNNIIVYGPIP